MQGADGLHSADSDSEAASVHDVRAQQTDVTKVKSTATMGLPTSISVRLDCASTRAHSALGCDGAKLAYRKSLSLMTARPIGGHQVEVASLDSGIHHSLGVACARCNSLVLTDERFGHDRAT